MSLACPAVNPLITVIVPCYNCSSTLAECVKSITTALNAVLYEIILIDDGSTDDTPIIAHELIASNPQLAFLRIPNSGPGIARNLGIDSSKGKYILFVDSDDLLLPFDSCFVSELDGLDSHLVVFGFRLSSPYTCHDIVYPGCRIQYRADWYLLCDYFAKQRIKPVVWAKLYSSSLIKSNRIRFIDASAGEDSHFILQYLFYTRTVRFISSISYIHRSSNPQSLSATLSPSRIDSLLESLSQQRLLLASHGNIYPLLIVNIFFSWYAFKSILYLSILIILKQQGQAPVLLGDFFTVSVLRRMRYLNRCIPSRSIGLALSLSVGLLSSSHTSNLLRSSVIRRLIEKQ
jgi:glycosyltransferase involved in cell wall biosynthesis